MLSREVFESFDTHCNGGENRSPLDDVRLRVKLRALDIADAALPSFVEVLDAPTLRVAEGDELRVVERFDGTIREQDPLEWTLAARDLGRFAYPHGVDGERTRRVEEIERDGRSTKRHARESVAAAWAGGDFEQIVTEGRLLAKGVAQVLSLGAERAQPAIRSRAHREPMA